MYSYVCIRYRNIVQYIYNILATYLNIRIFDRYFVNVLFHINFNNVKYCVIYILESHVLVYFKSIYNYSVATTTIQSSHVMLEKVTLVTKI